MPSAIFSAGLGGLRDNVTPTSILECSETFSFWNCYACPFIDIVGKRVPASTRRYQETTWDPHIILLAPVEKRSSASAWWSGPFIRQYMMVLTCWSLDLRDTKGSGGSYNLPLLMTPGKSVSSLWVRLPNPAELRTMVTGTKFTSALLGVAVWVQSCCQFLVPRHMHLHKGDSAV